MRSRRSRSSRGDLGKDLGIPGCDPVSVLGRGGFGTVYKCYEAAHARYVAVKVLRVDGLDDGVRQRFERECRALGSLSGHPHIVPIHSSGMSRTDLPYIVMDYISGGSAADRLAARGSLGWRRAVEVGVKLAGALQTAHTVGIVHRDVKPQNVLMSEYEEPKLGDFGISSLPNGFQTASGVITATVAHASPEVLQGHKASAASDQYSLASTIFTLMMGHAPFVQGEDEELSALITRVLTSRPPSLASSGVPQSIASVVERGLEKSLDDRFSTVEELGRALQAAEVEEGYTATAMAVGHRAGPSQPPSEVTRQRAGRSRPADAPAAKRRVSKLPALLAVAVVAALSGSGTFAAMRSSGRSPDRVEPKATATPASTPDARPQAVRLDGPVRAFPIRVDDGGHRVAGVLRSPRSLCVGGRAISLWHARAGDDHRVSKGRVGADGTWAFEGRRVPGRFYASVAKQERRAEGKVVACEEARSRTVVVRDRASGTGQQEVVVETNPLDLDPEPENGGGGDVPEVIDPTPRPTSTPAPTDDCPSGYHPDGSGGCVVDDNCPIGYHPDGTGGCTKDGS